MLNAECFVILREPMFERSFGAGGGAGDEMDGDAGFLAQAEDCGDGVFLCAPDDEPRDDVGDAHGVTWVFPTSLPVSLVSYL